MARRVLPGGVGSSRSYLVDAAGNGDFPSIQAALNAAHAQNPSQANRWLVLVGPGAYAESLTLYDHVDLAGLAPGPGAVVTAPTGASAIGTVASCWVSNLRLSGGFNPIVNVNTALTQVTLCGVTIAESVAQTAGVKVTAGACLLLDCELAPGGSALHLAGGTAAVRRSRLGRAALLGAVSEAVVRVEGGTLELEHSLVENLSNSGPGVLFNANPTRARLLGCVIRKADGFEAVRADMTAGNVFVYGCLLNGTVDGDIANTGGNQVLAGL